ncbi:neuronal acetylcholine receptor subunit alpha-10-like isoform X1 [Mytilus edulis]|uniref:neuronal acetylcholine receptor subunit alpha-10-like isoform X1 n=1 Tax=Mytilus edulis TaxID=6550 RepID=UPI0039EF7344
MWNYVVLLIFQGMYLAQTQLLTTELYQHLFMNTNYTIDLLPVCQNGGNVTVKLQTALRQVMDVNEREQIVTVNIWFRMKWNDCRFQWNASDFDGITSLNVPYASVWVPDITLYDSAADEVMMPGRENYRATINSDGSVSYNFPTVLKSVCRIDVTYFPFDTQVCRLTFGSWSHHGFEMDVVNSATEGDLATYIEHNEWDIAAFPVIRHVLHYNCCPEPYPDVTFYLTLKRKSQFYVLTVLFPCILTASVAALTFILPPESGEKVSLGVTVLLSLAVFLLMVSEQLPASSDTYPYIGMYFASSMTLVALSCFMTVMVLNLHYRGENGRKVPSWVRKLIINRLGVLVCSEKNTHRFYKSHRQSSNNSAQVSPENIKEERKTGNGHVPNGDNNEITFVSNRTNKDLLLHNRDPISGYLREQSTVLTKLEKHTEKDQDLRNNIDEWHEVAFIMDRFFLFFYIFTTVLTSIIFLAKMTEEA